MLTGLSGSGKSSLAFDTLYAEGQRRYVESLSAYARQFLGQMDKPDVDAIEGLSPAISIDQKTTSHNPRSTVGTVTEIYDYLRLLFARVGVPHCPGCDRPIASQSVDQMIDTLTGLEEGTRLQILAPVVRGRKGEHQHVLEELRREGLVRARIDGAVVDLDAAPALAKHRQHTIEAVVDRLVRRQGDESRLADSLEAALRLGGGLAVVVAGEEEILFSQALACPHCGISVEELTPRMFSFNSPYGACPTCSGLGYHLEPDPERIIPDPGRSLRDGAIAPWRESDYYSALVMAVARELQIPTDVPVARLEPAMLHAILHGTGDRPIPFRHVGYFGRRGDGRVRYAGVVEQLRRRLKEASESDRAELETYFSPVPCPACKGRRLKPASLAVRVGERSIAEVTAMDVGEALRFFESLALTDRDEAIGREILKEIRERLRFLANVGLGYLTLERSATTLSGGEAQRIRLATQIGSGLVGVLYILDEPSIGLHPRDNGRLIATLERLRDLGNTVLVVEHDEETMRAADWIVDVGPGAGRLGGEVVAAGPIEAVMREERSITGQYLSGRRRVPVPESRRQPDGRYLEILGAAENNLKNITVRIPLGLLVGVTGVSGSGKSTLVNEIIHKRLAMDLNGARQRPGRHAGVRGLEYLDKVIAIDQAPIGRTPRSNPATYTGLFDLVRQLFAQLPEARMRGYGPGRFSFNVKGGRCEACRGDGILKIEMHFLPDVYVPCEVCKGRRYNRETLEIRYRDHSIADVLDLTVAEAKELFHALPRLHRKLTTMDEVGLGYITLGQPATTLSGGEAQRVKLATELSRRSDGRTLYILDEPTTGLHTADIEQLLAVMQRLVAAGDTVLVIEHNLDVIKTCDLVIDLGPEGGAAGGEVVAVGTPEEVSRCERSHTGAFLRPILERRAQAVTA